MERIFAAGAMPSMPDSPSVPCPCPAMTPATSVPSMPQKGSPAVRPEPVKSGPVDTELARSGCRAATPVLSTATVIPAPSVVRHACLTCRPASHHSWPWTPLPATL